MKTPIRGEMSINACPQLRPTDAVAPNRHPGPEPKPPNLPKNQLNKMVPKRLAQGRRNLGPGTPKIDNLKMRSGVELRKSGRKSAETGAPGHTKTIVLHCRGHTNHKIRASPKSIKNKSKINPKSSQNQSKSLPGTAPKQHREKVT